MAKHSFPLLLTAALICATLPAASQELPEGNGKDLVAADCNSCHLSPTSECRCVGVAVVEWAADLTGGSS